jgi:hypothetical protein
MCRNQRGRKAFAKVMRMADEYVDPSGTTDQFRAFAQAESAEPPTHTRMPLIIGGVVALIAVVAVVVVLLVR